MDLSSSTVAITGATGFLGRYLVAKCLERGARVVAVVRCPARARDLEGQGVEVRRADLAEPAHLTEAFRGADAVISNAAAVSLTAPKATARTNLEGTRNVFEALARAGVRRAVAVSSSTAYPAGRALRDERTPLRRGPIRVWNAYGESKAAAERLAWTLASRHGVALTTVRPSGITAPDDPRLMAQLERLLALPVAPFPAWTTLGVVHAADVAEAVARALERPAISAGKAYNLQGTTTSLWQLGSTWKRAGGRAPVLRVPIPAPWCLRFDDARARKELDWTPRTVEALCREVVDLRAAQGSSSSTAGKPSSSSRSRTIC